MELPTEKKGVITLSSTGSFTLSCFVLLRIWCESNVHLYGGLSVKDAGGEDGGIGVTAHNSSTVGRLTSRGRHPELMFAL